MFCRRAVNNLRSCQPSLTSGSDASAVIGACHNHLAVRRKIDAVVFEVRKEMAKVAVEMADKTGEPPLSEQD